MYVRAAHYMPLTSYGAYCGTGTLDPPRQLGFEWTRQCKAENHGQGGDCRCKSELAIRQSTLPASWYRVMSIAVQHGQSSCARAAFLSALRGSVHGRSTHCMRPAALASRPCCSALRALAHSPLQHMQRIQLSCQGCDNVSAAECASTQCCHGCPTWSPAQRHCSQALLGRLRVVPLLQLGVPICG